MGDTRINEPVIKAFSPFHALHCDWVSRTTQLSSPRPYGYAIQDEAETTSQFLSNVNAPWFKLLDRGEGPF